MGLNSLDKKSFSNMIHLTDELVTCSDLVTNLYEDIYTKKITQINSIPSFKNFDSNGPLENDFEVDSQKYKIACAGTICYRKGFDRFLEIAERLDSEKFTMYWFGKFDESAYSEWVKLKLQLPKFQHVVIISLPSQIAYLHALSKCDLFLFTSREESMGMVLFDAMHANLPIISLEENGSKLILDKGKGQLIGTNDIVNIHTIVLDSIESKSEKTKNSVTENHYQVEFAKFAQLFEKY
jgi:glycosyltransferase involved in cell wall biosynthesis